MKNATYGKAKYWCILLLCTCFQWNFGQSVEISGKVLDASNQSEIIGANVIEKGTTNGTTTDFDGNFTLKVSGKNAVIVISYISYKTQEIKVGDNKKLSVLMQPDTQTLDDVVVIGYGTSKRSDLTGAVSTISGQELTKIPVASVSEALTGRLAGLQVTSAEGSPDAEIILKVRGGGSFSGDNSPLIIVDGFPVSSISDISPNDIENITVLKDASSTAIYGARGANGVVLITTKGGRENEKLAVSFNVFSGARQIAKTLYVLDPLDYTQWQYEYAMIRNNGNPSSYEQYFGSYADIGQFANERKINWQREIYGRTGRVNNYNLSLRGGTKKVSYNFNYTKFDEEAIMIGSAFVRDNISLNLKSKPNDKVELSMTFRYSDTKITGGGANEQREFSSSQDARLRHVIGYTPFYVPGLTEDDPDEEVAGFLINPFLATADNDRLVNRRNFNMLASMKWKIIDNMRLTSDIGLDYYNILNKRFYGRSTFYVRNVPAANLQGKPALFTEDRNEQRFRFNNVLEYDFKKFLDKKHVVKLMVGQELIEFKRQDLTNITHGLPLTFNFQDAQNLTSQGSPFLINNFIFPEDRLFSFFSRVNYDLSNKYIFTATFRADGSSKFTADNRWGFFPSAAAAWKISEEEFLKKYEWLNLLKLRVSYGEVGNDRILGGQQGRVFLSNSTGWINGFNNFFAPSQILPNPDLKWEALITRNLGLDYEFLNGRINGSLDVYRNSSKDLLVNYPLFGEGGYTSQFRNIGEIQNQGFEGSINYAIFKKQDFSLNFSFNINFNQNKILSLGGLDELFFSTGWASTAINNDFLARVGMPVGIMYGYKTAGRYEVSDFDYNGSTYTLRDGIPNSSLVTGYVQPGAMRIADVNGDGIINLEDMTIIGDANPLHTGGFNLSGTFKNFDFSANFNWSYGQDVYNASKIEHTTANSANPIGQYRNLLSQMAGGNRWTNIDPSTGTIVTDPTALTALNASTSIWSPYMQRYVLTDWAIEDASFLRLNTLTFGYSLNESWISKLNISKLRLYVTANNVFVWTNYSGLDPEVSTRRQTPLTPNVDYSPYPRSRMYVFGMNINF
ncbi:MAG: SusC/RagA family TonB-linked outer membrane protein [Flavobacterium sp.]